MDYDVGKQFELMQAKLDYVVGWIRSVEEDSKKPVEPVARPVVKPKVEVPVEDVEVPEEETEAEQDDEPSLFEEAEEVSESSVPIAKFPRVKKPVAKKQRWA